MYFKFVVIQYTVFIKNRPRVCDQDLFRHYPGMKRFAIQKAQTQAASTAAGGHAFF